MKKNVLGLILLAGIPLTLSSCSFASNKNSSSIPQIYFKATSDITIRDVGETTQSNYLRSTGEQTILVLPVSFSDYEGTFTDSVLSNVEAAFAGDNSKTSWESVSSFYNESSFGNLDLSFVFGDVYDIGITTNEFMAKGTKAGSVYDPVYAVQNAALAAYKKSNETKGTELDKDEDGFVDGVWFIYDAPNMGNDSSLSSAFWAFTGNASNVSNLSSPTINSFSWASYDFIYEGYGKTGIDAHTYIHETGHMIGLQDYYDYDGKASPMGMIDMMDYNVIDHNAYSKYSLGWSEPYVIDKEGDITLRDSESTGDFAIIPTEDGFNGTFADEYLLLEYYTPTGLNEKDSTEGYPGNGVRGFTKSGLRVYHVDSRLAKTSKTSSRYSFTYSDYVGDEDKFYTVLSHSNSVSRSYLDDKYRLLQEMDCTGKRNFAGSKYYANNSTLFHAGDSFSIEDYSSSFMNGDDGLMNDGSALDYSFVVTEESSGSVTISFSKN